MSHIATILHLSDLHLVEELTEQGRSLWVKGPKTHSFAKLDALTAALFEITEIEKTELDVMTLTGDVTTDGSVGSLKTALEFIEKEDIYRYKPERRILRGLCARSESRIVVPGNHDRYAGRYWPMPQQEANDDLERIFSAPRQYPYAVGYRRVRPQSTADGTDVQSEAPAIIFFVIDSTLVQSNHQNFFNRIARGRIELGECNRLKELAVGIKETGEISDLDGKPMRVDYDEAVKIALLHHHPVLPDSLTETGLEKHLRVLKKLKAGLTLMENSSAFIDACFDAEIDLVLFGHQHREYEVVLGRTASGGNRQHIVRLLCCPSTSEYSEASNGFNLVDVYSDKYVLKYYRWIASKVGIGSFDLTQSRTVTMDRFTRIAKGR
jgi:3',5'-cyclic AMP phosphodiesterase CpdA